MKSILKIGSLLVVLLLSISSVHPQDLSEMSKEDLVNRALDAMRLEENVKKTMEATMGMSLRNSMAMDHE